MKRKDFVTLILGTIGGMLFALGMCMAMLPEWNLFKQGIVVGVIGVVVLLIALIVRRKMEGKPAIKLSGRVIGLTLFGILGTLVLGVGMCMTMIWDGYMLKGVIVGIIGIVMLICLIPMTKGIKDSDEVKE